MSNSFLKADKVLDSQTENGGNTFNESDLTELFDAMKSRQAELVRLGLPDEQIIVEVAKTHRDIRKRILDRKKLDRK